MTNPTKTARDELVQLSFPAQGDLITLARFTAATIAARAGFNVEEIEDLRLAVDELCVSVGPLGNERLLHMEFRRVDDTISVDCMLQGGVGREASPDEAASSVAYLTLGGGELSEQLLDALVDEHGLEAREGERYAWLRKRRGSNGA